MIIINTSNRATRKRYHDLKDDVIRLPPALKTINQQIFLTERRAIRPSFVYQKGLVKRTRFHSREDIVSIIGLFATVKLDFL